MQYPNMCVCILNKMIRITQGKVRPYRPLFEATLGKCGGGYVQSKRKHPSQNTKTKTTLLSSGHAPTPSWVYLANKRLKKEILAPAPGTSRVGELNPRRKDPNSSWNKSNRDKSVSAEETLERYAHVSNQALQGGRLIAKILTIKPNRCTKFSNLFLE